MQLLDHIYQSRRRLPEIKADVSRIYSSLLAESETIREANFRAIRSQDLELLFAKYDETFFDGLLYETIQRSGAPISHFQEDDKSRRHDNKVSNGARSWASIVVRNRDLINAALFDVL